MIQTVQFPEYHCITSMVDNQSSALYKTPSWLRMAAAPSQAEQSATPGSQRGEILMASDLWIRTDKRLSNTACAHVYRGRWEKDQSHAHVLWHVHVQTMGCTLLFARPAQT